MQILNITDDAVSPVLYGMSNDTMNSYYRDKIDKMKNYLSPTSYHNENYDNASYYYSDEYVNKVKRSLRDLEISGKDEDTLYYYKDTREANLATIEWIMANKKLRNLYDRGLINGYSNTNYVHNKYEAELKYMSVMDGYLEEDSDEFVEYYNSDIQEISLSDRDIVLANWNKALNMYNNKNIDPTDK